MRGMAFAACFSLLAGVALAGENWPNFHGPANDNHSDAPGCPGGERVSAVRQAWPRRVVTHALPCRDC